MHLDTRGRLALDLDEHKDTGERRIRWIGRVRRIDDAEVGEWERIGVGARSDRRDADARAAHDAVEAAHEDRAGDAVVTLQKLDDAARSGVAGIDERLIDVVGVVPTAGEYVEPLVAGGGGCRLPGSRRADGGRRACNEGGSET
jgi:hypothetical protein